MVGHLIENFFALDNIVGHQLTIVVLTVSHHSRHGVVD